jgi:hypothetical protein
MARASVRSVSTGMERVAARNRRVARSTPGSATSTSPAWSHRESGPASGPTRAKGGPVARGAAAASASGSLGALRARTIAPAASTMRMLLVPSERSMPAWWVISVPPSLAATRTAGNNNRPRQPPTAASTRLP